MTLSSLESAFGLCRLCNGLLTSAVVKQPQKRREMKKYVRLCRRNGSALLAPFLPSFPSETIAACYTDSD